MFRRAHSALWALTSARLWCLLGRVPDTWGTAMNVDGCRTRTHVRHAVAAAAAGAVLAISAGSALAQIVSTPGNEVAVGTTAADNPRGRYVTIANGGHADTYETYSVAVSTTGSADNGLVTASGTECAARGWVVVGGRCSQGAFLLGVSTTGDAERYPLAQSSPPAVAASGLGCADSWIVGVSGTSCSTGVLAVSGTGYATGTTALANGLVPSVAVSGSGAAKSPQVAVGGQGAQGGTLAVAPSATPRRAAPGRGAWPPSRASATPQAG